MDRLREAWRNDVMLSMASSFCVGLGAGICMLALAVPHPWAFAPMGVALMLFWSGMMLLDRAGRVRAERWQRREWR